MDVKEKKSTSKRDTNKRKKANIKVKATRMY